MNIIGKHCIIIAGSPECNIPNNICISESDFVIACDYGYIHSKNLNIKPDLIVGDFDSYSGELPKNIPIIRVNPVKNDTDTMLAVKQGLQHGFKSFIIYGATGGRLDHQMANLQIAAYIASIDADCRIIDNKNILYTLKNGSLTLQKKDKYFLSVFSYTKKSYGVSLRGLKYPLDNYTMTNTYPIGISNEFDEDFAMITVLDGILFIIVSAP